jgi:hypothetical protein
MRKIFLHLPRCNNDGEQSCELSMCKRSTADITTAVMTSLFPVTVQSSKTLYLQNYNTPTHTNNVSVHGSCRNKGKDIDHHHTLNAHGVIIL